MAELTRDGGMRNIKADPGYKHCSPRERLARHGMNSIKDRLGRAKSRADYDALCAVVAGLPDSAIDFDRGQDINRVMFRVSLWGMKFRAVWDYRYEAVVTVIPGWRDRVLR